MSAGNAHPVRYNPWLSVDAVHDMLRQRRSVHKFDPVRVSMNLSISASTMDGGSTTDLA